MSTERWWYLELAAEFPELEIYHGHGWGPAQELGLVELGDRVMTAEATWLFTWLYSSDRDKTWAAVGGLFAMIIERVRRDRPVEERVLLVLAGREEDEVTLDQIPDGWTPDTQAWEHGRYG